MDNNTNLSFYAMTTNGHDASIHVTYEDAVSELSMRIAEDDTDSYGVERIDGIWQLIKRMGEFEDYSDEWMETVIDKVREMVEKRKAYEEKILKKVNKPTENK